ncbi:hypothetical protein PIB30_118142 [Stylosanthes scabra]|uniref:Uncharacterized protein n=1 Tax=Stylosanthes scabra TaxID=79078 RepID=A0ABU6X501_9FABA|nr:hypothetical protein [Stylosanthes scabra]
MESFFSLISEEDITYWKQKENLESSTPMHTDETIGNGFGLNGFERDVGSDAQRSAGIIVEQLQPSKGDHSSTPLYQRLIAALISEEDCDSGSEDFKYDAFDAEFETDGEFELSGMDYRSRANSQFTCHSAYNGYRIFGNPEHDEGENDAVRIPSTGLNSSLADSVNGLLHDKASRCSELQYDCLDINDKLLLELQSIGIALEPVPEMSHTDDEGIMEDIARLEEHYQGQVSKKKGVLDGLLKSASVGKEVLEKDFEQRAMERLIVMAYEKYMACWGPGTSGGRNSSNKMAKQAALGLVKRTLERCHRFEDTGKSCFSEPVFKDMFFAAAPQLSAVRQLDGMEAESSKPYVSSLSLEARTGAFYIILFNSCSYLLVLVLFSVIMLFFFLQLPWVHSRALHNLVRIWITMI